MSRSSAPFSMPWCHIQLNSTALRSLASAAGVYGPPPRPHPVRRAEPATTARPLRAGRSCAHRLSMPRQSRGPRRTRPLSKTASFDQTASRSSVLWGEDARPAGRGGDPILSAWFEFRSTLFLHPAQSGLGTHSPSASISPRSLARPVARLFLMKASRPMTSAMTGPKAARVRVDQASLNVRPERSVGTVNPQRR